MKTNFFPHPPPPPPPPLHLSPTSPLSCLVSTPRLRHFPFLNAASRAGRARRSGTCSTWRTWTSGSTPPRSVVYHIVVMCRLYILHHIIDDRNRVCGPGQAGQHPPRSVRASMAEHLASPLRLYIVSQPTMIGYHSRFDAMLHRIRMSRRCPCHRCTAEVVMIYGHRCMNASARAPYLSLSLSLSLRSRSPSQFLDLDLDLDLSLDRYDA